MSSWRFTPLERGFESYYGYLGGGEDYWLHGTDTELDFWDGDAPDFSHTCWQQNDCPHDFYSANVFAEKAVGVIEGAAQNRSKLFLYLAWQSVHSGGRLQLQAPQDYIDGFTSTVPLVGGTSTKRRELAGMVRSLDEGVGNVSAALSRAGMLEDTLLIFSTDNGKPHRLAPAEQRRFASAKNSALDLRRRASGRFQREHGVQLAAARHEAHAVRRGCAGRGVGLGRRARQEGTGRRARRLLPRRRL